MIEQLEQLDQNLFLYLNALGHPYLDIFFWYISDKFFWIPLHILFLFLVWKKGGWKLIGVTILFFALLILLCDQISVKLFKEVFERYRPTHNADLKAMVKTVIKPNGEEYRGGLYSFVSSHATNYFGMAVLTIGILSPLKKKWSILIIGLALLIGYSRIYLGVHYPSDVLVGAVLGSIIGFLVYKLYQFTNKKWLHI